MEQPAQISSQPIPPTVVTNLQPPPPSQKTNKPSLIILAVLVIALFGVGSFWLRKSSSGPKIVVTPTPTAIPTLIEAIPTLEVLATPTPDLTAGWKTYTNTKYGYSIKLPPTWGEYSMKDFSFSQTIGEKQYLYLGPARSAKKPPQSIQILVEKKEVVEERKRTGMHPEQRCIEEKVKIGQDEVLATKIFCVEWHRGSSFAIEKGDDVYTIDNVMEDSSEWPIFNQILSTFKFLE